MRKSFPLADLVLEARPGFACGDIDPNGTVQVRMNNVSSDGALVLESLRRVPRDAGDLARFKVEVGDVLFNATNSPELVGKSALFRGFVEPVVYSNHFIRLRPVVSRLDSGYLSRWLHMLWRRGDFSRMCKQWVNQASVASDRLLALEIPLPPLPEQRRIAAILDKADELRAKRWAALEQLNGLTQAMFWEMFGEGVRHVSLSELTTKITDGVHLKPEYTETGVPFISVKDIVAGELRFDDCKYVSVGDHEIHTRRSKAEKGDVLYTKVGTYGKAALVDTDREFSLYVSVCLIKPRRDLVDPVFLASALQMPAVKLQADRRIKGIGVPDLHLEEIRQFLVPLPTLTRQREFSRRNLAVQKLRRIQREFLRDLDDTFASLQHQAFTGDL